MLDCMLEEPVDEIYEEDCKLSVIYDEFIKKTCKCNWDGECECMTFEEFKEQRMDELASIWEDYDVSDYEERYG